MAYATWSVVFGEQPTAAKWNILGTNDASFHDGTGIDDDAILARHVSSFDKSNLANGDVNPYKFAARRNAAANTANGSFGKITFDTEDFDTNNNFSGGSYTVPVAGFYLISAGVTASATATGQRVILAVYKNSSEVQRLSTVWSSGGSQNLGPSGSKLLQFAANDVIEIYVFGTVAMVIDVSLSSTQPFFSGYLVSRT